MAIEEMQIHQLAQVISQATAPSFLLGAVSGFVAVLMGRMNGVIDRIRAVNAIADDDAARIYLKADLPRLKLRARLLNDAVYLAVGAAICTTLLVILAFASALLGWRHEPGAAVMFVVALGLMSVSLVTLAREVRMALTDYDHVG
jgi:Mg/Co/Ni transporter MgtE